MTQTEFKNLEDKKKADIILEEGVYIGKRTFSSYIVVLYQVDAFYVEVFYISYRKHISHYNYWLSPEILSLYPETVNLPQLFAFISAN